MANRSTRRSFLQSIGIGSLGAVATAKIASSVMAAEPDVSIIGESGVQTTARPKGVWEPVSDRKIGIGIVGNGVCKMGASFGFQDHPNVEIVAVSDLIPARCQDLASLCRCNKTYPSLAALLEDDKVEAIVLATDAPSHAQQSIDVLNRGKHVATCVPAVFASVDDAHRVFDAVKSSGRKYMMLETSAYHADCHAMRQIHRAGGFGKTYVEGEYFHYMPEPIPSFRDWRVGLPPQWYATHSDAYYVCVTGGSFTEVSCMAMPSVIPHLQPANNPYKNPFGTEVALFRNSDGGMSRMAISWDTLGPGGELGRIRGEFGAMWNGGYSGTLTELPDLDCPPLPPTLSPGGHGGSHGQLANEFVTAILEDREPLVNIAWALNMTIAGIVAHESALKNGELLKIPQFTWPLT